MTIKMECIEITDMEGYFVVRFQLSSNDSAIYADGIVGIQITTAEGFEVGKLYGLDLAEK